MNCLISKCSTIYIFLLISKEICGCIFPFGETCSNTEATKFLMEKNEHEAFYPAFIDTLKCVLCVSISYTKAIFDNFVKKTNNIFTPGKTYRYKPPPSLFETIAVWTGAINENNSDDEIWVSQKLFMLASTLIFSMLLLHFGQNWLAKLSGNAKQRKFRICVDTKELETSRTPSSVSLTTCIFEFDENENH